MRRILAVLVTVLMLPLLSMPFVSATDPECAPGTATGSCTFTGPTPGGVYVYDTIIVPAGVTVTSDLSLVLHARNELRVEGNVVAPTVTLVSDLAAIVSGNVRGLDGNALTPNGGDVSVTASNLLYTGVIQSGNGAPGVDDVQNVGDTLPTVAAHATPGGNGGNVVISSPSLILQGSFIVGNGGKGGSAQAIGGTMSASAIGGDGGASGNLVLPPTYNVLNVIGEGLVTGGEGGDGGNAFSQVSQTPPSYMALPSDAVTGPVNDATQQDPGTGPVPPLAAAVPALYGPDSWPAASDSRSFVACKGADSTGYGEMGKTGCQGWSGYEDRTTDGGNGGYGILRGGRGGDATAYGGQGGMGGRGGNGFNRDCTIYTSGQSTCSNHFGGQGGRGGTGGNAYSYGGNGGSSVVQGGAGGDAYAFGGKGGTGGLGGDGGGGWVNMYDGDQVSQTLATIGCMKGIYTFEAFELVIGCGDYLWASKGTYFVCGDPGAAGPGGDPGQGYASGGAGGRNLQGLGTAGPSGNSYGYPGYWGNSGTQGGRQNTVLLVNVAPAQYASHVCG